MKTKAIVLLSGGIDSTVSLGMAIASQKECLALSFDYGQRHRIELQSAKAISQFYGIPYRLIQIDPTTFGQTPLITTEPIPKKRSQNQILKEGIPSTYVPARNTLFLTYALIHAELWKAQEIYFGANAMDANPYPDCRPEFFMAFQQLIDVATRQSLEQQPPQVVTPLIFWDKAKIIREGIALGCPLELTWSCYDPTSDSQPCGCCDACILRNESWKVLKNVV